jgi:hypothetical protein
LFNAKAAIKGNGEPTHLLTAVLADGKAWCVVQPIAPLNGTDHQMKPDP